MKPPAIRVIIPAHNEAKAIAKVIRDIPQEIATEIIVVNNASTDETAAIAAEAGAIVVNEPTPGYGRACLKGIAYMRDKAHTDIVVFIDGDYSDFPEEMPAIVRPLLANEADLVIGSRALGVRDRGAMTLQQIFGNWLATRLIKLLYGVKFTDLGPFRAIRFENLIQLDMQDTTYGWTVEMQVKAAKLGYRCTEVPVKYRKRIGFSKISGTVKGTIMAGYKILYTIAKHM